MLFDELKDVAKKEDVTAVLIGGDVFDTPKISQRLYNKLQRVLKKISVPVYVVPGNHDIFGQTTETLEDTMLGSLDAGGVIELITRDHGGVMLSGDGITISLQAQEYNDDLDHGNPDDYEVVINPMADYHILMTHSMLTEKPFIGHHTLVKDVHSSADIILGAHYHPGFDIIEQGNTTFVGPGAMARLEATKTEASRTLQYAIIDIDSTGYDVALHPFKNQRAGKDIFDLQSIREERVRKDALSAFRKQVDDTNNFQGQDVNQILKSIATSNNIDWSLVTSAMGLIIEAEKNDDQLNQELAGFAETPLPRKIVKVQLVNFQSWESAEIDFTDGLNALTGASDNGKTAVIRAIRWALYNDPKGTDFIRHGKKRALVGITFEDGSKIFRERTNSGAGSYTVVDPSGQSQEFTGFGNNIPVAVTNTHQMPKIQLTKDSEVSLNIGYQLDGPFLIGDSAANRAAVIGRLTGVHVVDIAIRNNAKTITNLQRDISASAKLEQEMNERLANDFNDIPVLEGAVNRLELLVHRFEMLEKKRDELLNVQRGYDAASKDIADSTKHLVKLAPALQKSKSLLTGLEAAVTQWQELEKLDAKLILVNKTQQHLEEQLAGMQSIGDAKMKILDLSDAVQAYKELSDVAEVLNTETKYIEGIIVALADIDHLPVPCDVDELEFKVKKFRELVNIANLIHTNDSSIEMYDDGIAIEDNNISKLTDAYKALLKKAGKCPTCHTALDDALIEQLSL
ncbi:chromosome segregation protein [compost metagenome]